MKKWISRLGRLLLIFGLISVSVIIPGQTVSADSTWTQSAGTYNSIAVNLTYDYRVTNRFNPDGSGGYVNPIFGRTISKVGFDLWKSGTPNGNIEFEIRSNVPTSGTELGTLLWSGVATAASALDGTPTLYTLVVSPTIYVPFTANITVGMYYTGTSTNNDLVWTRTKIEGSDYGGQQPSYFHLSWSGTSQGNYHGEIKYTYDYGSTSTSSVSTVGVNSWEVLANSAILNGNWLTASANATILGFQYGLSTGNYSTNLTASGNFPSLPYNLTASGLTAGTNYFYRAEAYANSQWYYGGELQFVTKSTVSVDTLGANPNSTYASLAGVIQALNGNTNYTTRGILTSTDNITWSGGKTESGNWTGTTVYLANSGIFSEIVTSLVPNTLYYYKAFAGNSQTGLAYGTIRTFTTLTIAQQTNVPNVQAISVNLFAVDSSTGLQALTFNAIVNQSDTPVVLQGIRYSVVLPTVSSISLLGGIQYQIGTFNGIYDNPLYKFNPTGAIGAYSVISSYSILPGAVVYWQAYAQNDAGLGFSNNMTYSVTGQTYIIVHADYSTVAGNSVTMHGSFTGLIYNPTKYLFSWGETSSGDTNQVEVSPGSSFSYTQGGLKTNTTYYWRAGVMFGGAIYWSALPASTFITQGAITAITGVCDITTLPVTGAAMTSFNGSMSINAINSGVATQIGFYISYNSDGSNPLRLPIAPSGSYNVGIYDFTIGGLAANALVYYAAFAINPAGQNIGKFLPVQLSASGINPNLPPVSGSITNIAAAVIVLAKYQGLDNPLGHYAFLLEIMLIIALLFGILMICVAVVYKDSDNSLALKVLAVILGTAEVVTMIAFIFTGWLGIWPFIFGGAAIVILIIVVITIFGNKGSGG